MPHVFMNITMGFKGTINLYTWGSAVRTCSERISRHVPIDSGVRGRPQRRKERSDVLSFPAQIRYHASENITLLFLSNYSKAARESLRITTLPGRPSKIRFCSARRTATHSLTVDDVAKERRPEQLRPDAAMRTGVPNSSCGSLKHW